MANPDLTVQNVHTETGSDNWYRQLICSLPLAVYTCNAQGYISFYNKAAVELWGRAPEIGKELWCGSWAIYHTDGSPMSLDECPMAVALKEGRAVVGEEIIVERPDGVRLYVAHAPTPLFDTENNLIGAVNMLTDITARKEDEKKLAWMAAIVKYSDDAIISKTLSSIVTSWNDAAERIFGYTAGEMIGESIVKLMPPDRQEEEPLIIERLKNGERVEHFETKRVTKDGKLIDVSLTISPVKDSNGIVVGISKIARDVTTQKVIERQVRESEERMRMAVASTKLGTWDYNPQSGELNWSSECRNIYGVPDDMEIDFRFFSKYIYPEDAINTLSAISNAMDPAGDGNYDIKFRVTRYRDGQLRWIHSQGKVYFNANLLPERFIGTVLDITEEKMAKARLETIVQDRTIELKKANDSLAKSNKELEQFAYIASHDLQEPLRKIQTFADRLKVKAQGTLTGELNDYIHRITNSAEKMSVLISGLLDYARIGRISVAFTKVDLNDVLSSVIDDLDFVILRKGAEITADTLPVIEAIPLQISQLFYNLLNNSLKFSRPDVKPVITIRHHELDAEDTERLQLPEDVCWHQLDFTDNGIGFNAEYAERIFTIFQRLNNKENYPGTGIGLALCKKVVENHDGLISAESKENNGSTFTIILPEKQTRIV